MRNHPDSVRSTTASTGLRLLALAALALALALAACGDDDAPADGGGSDAGVMMDASPGDGGMDATVTPDGGSDGGEGADAGAPPTDIRFLTPSRAVDLTPNGRTAVVQDPGSAAGDVYVVDVETGDLRVVTTTGDPARDFATAYSGTGRLTALHGVPIQAGTWTMTDGWSDLPIPYTMGCDDDRASAWDVSADGTVVVGMGWDGCVPTAFRWTIAGADVTTTPLEKLGSTGSSALPVNRATVVSDDGSVAAGFAQTDMVDRWPAVWPADGAGFLLPGTIPDAPGEVLSISADGSMVAGIWNLEGFLWTEARGVVPLGMLPTGLGGDSTFPNAIAADGALIFGGSGGFGLTTAFVWTEEAGMRSLAEIATANGIAIAEGTLLTNVLAASADGSVLLGTALSPMFTEMTFVMRLPVSAYGL